MKSEYTPAKSKPASKIYPYLARHKNTSLIVLFTGKKTGISLTEGCGYPFGEQRTDWIEDYFMILPNEDTITLSNT